MFCSSSTLRAASLSACRRDGRTSPPARSPARITSTRSRSDGAGDKAAIAAAAARAPGCTSSSSPITATAHVRRIRLPTSTACSASTPSKSARTTATMSRSTCRAPRIRLAGAAEAVVEDVARLGGFGIAAHPDSPKPDAALDGRSGADRRHRVAERRQRMARRKSSHAHARGARVSRAARRSARPVARSPGNAAPMGSVRPRAPSSPSPARTRMAGSAVARRTPPAALPSCGLAFRVMRQASARSATEWWSIARSAATRPRMRALCSMPSVPDACSPSSMR